MRRVVFDDSPRVTHTAGEIPGDPRSVQIVVDTVLREPDDQGCGQ